jgi:hypothetical protein
MAMRTSIEPHEHEKRKYLEMLRQQQLAEIQGGIQEAYGQMAATPKPQTMEEPNKPNKKLLLLED